MTRNLTLLSVALVFLGLAFQFAGSQSIWVDETTQMSGLSLPFSEQLAWLTGYANPVPGVPPDRMPPLSYWAGDVWAGLFGLSEMSMRLFGIVAILCGAPAIYLTAVGLAPRGADWRVPGFALAATYLTPGMIIQAVEIRAYPLYFAFAAWAVWAYMRALADTRARWLLALALFCLAAGYTHFFGVVMAGTLWFSLLVLRSLRKEKGFQVFLAGLATGASFIGLVPFIAAAVNVSATAEAGVDLIASLRDTLRMVFRMNLHGVHLSSMFIAGAVLVGLAGLLLASLIVLFRRRSAESIGLVLPLLIAVVALPALKLAVGSFDVLAPHYNLWMVPLFVLFLSLALADLQTRKIATVFAILMIAAHLAASLRLLNYADFYTHGPAERVMAALDAPEKTVVIHDGKGEWGMLYFPLYYLSEGRLTQIVRTEGESDRMVVPGGFSSETPDMNSFPIRVYARSKNLDSQELARRLQNPGDCGIPAMQEETAADIRSYCAFQGTTIAIARD